MLSISIVLFTVGLGLLAWAYSEYEAAQDLLSMGKRTIAKIVQIGVDPNDDENRPILMYELQDPQHKGHTFSIASRSGSKKDTVGDAINVIYLFSGIEGETRIREFSFWGIFYRMVMCVCLALPLLVISCSYFAYLLGG